MNFEYTLSPNLPFLYTEMNECKNIFFSVTKLEKNVLHATCSSAYLILATVNTILFLLLKNTRSKTHGQLDHLDGVPKSLLPNKYEMGKH